MSRSLRIASLPAMQPTVRFAGYVTTNATDSQVASALSPYFLNIQLWRSPNQLPRDWLGGDDSMIRGAPPGVTPVWGQGDDVSAVTVIGDPETPWRLVVGDGQLAITDLWLYDRKASQWPASACAACQTGVSGHSRREIDSFAPRAISRGGVTWPLAGV